MNFFFFDLDGTLEDSRKDMVAAAQHVREQLGLETREFSALVPHVNRGMRDLYLHCFDDYVRSPVDQSIDEPKVSHVQSLYEQRYGEFIAVQTTLYPDIRVALEDAKSLGKTAVITNKPEHLSKRLLDALGIIHLIDLVVGGDTCCAAKPSPIPLQHALSILGGQLPQDRVFMIGDSQGDSRAGALCGARTVWCAWGYQDQAPTDPAPLKTALTPKDLSVIFRAADL
jgi:phosphoglycolate phosphatase